MKKFFYRVQQGDCLTELSRKFKIPVNVLIYDNNLKKDVEEGDILYFSVPEGKVYVSSPKDDFYSVSKKYGVSEDELKEKNKTPYLYYGVLIII